MIGKVAKRVRCRCPLCGMLVTQKQLNGEHEFEFKIQIIGSRGRGKIYHIYREPDKVEGEAFVMFKLSLVQKLRDVADRLLDSIQSGGKKKREAVVVDADYEEAIPPVQIASFVGYESPVTETASEVVEEIIPQTRMGGEDRWQREASLDAKSVLEEIPRSEMVD